MHFRETIEVDKALHLEVLEADHSDELFALVEASRDHLAPYLPWADEHPSLQSIRDFIELRRRLFEHGRALPTVVIYDGDIAGGLGMDVIDPQTRTGELGYWLGRTFQGMGLMSRALDALLDTAFGEWEMHRLELQCTPDNTRSCAMARRVGFTHEGTRRQAGRVAGKRVDLELFAMLAHEH